MEKVSQVVQEGLKLLDLNFRKLVSSPPEGFVPPELAKRLQIAMLQTCLGSRGSKETGALGTGRALDRFQTVLQIPDHLLVDRISESIWWVLITQDSGNVSRQVRGVSWSRTWNWQSLRGWSSVRNGAFP